MTVILAVVMLMAMLMMVVVITIMSMALVVMNLSMHDGDSGDNSHDKDWDEDRTDPLARYCFDVTWTLLLRCHLFRSSFWYSLWARSLLLFGWCCCCLLCLVFDLSSFVMYPKAQRDE